MISAWGLHQTQSKSLSRGDRGRRISQVAFYWLIAQRPSCYLNPQTTGSWVPFEHSGCKSSTLLKAKAKCLQPFCFCFLFVVVVVVWGGGSFSFFRIMDLKTKCKQMSCLQTQTAVIADAGKKTCQPQFYVFT